MSLQSKLPRDAVGHGCGCQGAPPPIPAVTDVADGQDPAELSTEALIAHIVARYHHVHLAELADAVQMALRVETVHEGREACPLGLAQHLTFMLDDLRTHQSKEETVLFPMMLGGDNPMIVFPIARMTAEHDEVYAQLDELARLTADFTPPEHACSTWRRLYLLCLKLDVDLREHLRLENEVLFARF